MELTKQDVKLIAEYCVGKSQSEIETILVSHFNIILSEVERITAKEILNLTNQPGVCE